MPYLKSYLFVVLSLLLSVATKAQDTLSLETFKARAATPPQVQIDTVVRVDSIKTTVGAGEQVRTVLETTVKDTLVFTLKDDDVAQAIDKKWRDALALSDDLYDSITTMREEARYDVAVLDRDLPTSLLKERLEAINSRTPFNVEYNASLESVIKRYLKRNKPTMERLMGLSKFYFPMFEEALDKYDIPLEMKYLAIVESALRPRVRSRVGATGLWQFMYSTGKMYKLDVNSYVDDRMDPIKATEAACKYLSKLYEITGDWDLALAAYNSGPGNVSKAIRRSGGYRNYWNIRNNLPRETAGYVPAFLATMYLFEYADEHGYQPDEPPTTYYATDTIHVKQMITLQQVAQMTNVPLDEVQFLNPQYKLDIIPVVKDEKYYLRLPQDAMGRFVANEEAVYAFAKAELDKREKPLPELQKSSASIRYRVRSGDYLGKIAKKYGVRISQIKKWNNMRSDRLKIGQRLTIYPRKL